MINPQPLLLTLRHIIMIRNLQPPRRIIQHPPHTPLIIEIQLRLWQFRRR